jgi:hypothetical protein
MVLGVFSVTTATRQHFTVVTLKSPLDVRIWMSRGLPTRTRRRENSGFLPIYDEVRAPEKYEDMKDFPKLWLESSMSTLKAVALPRHLLDLSVILFMVGIGLYELSGWKSKPDARGTAYRNVFIVFIVTVLAYLTYHALILVGAAYDSKKKVDELATGSFREDWIDSGELYDFRDGRRFQRSHSDVPRELNLADVLQQLSGELAQWRRERQATPTDQLEPQQRHV